MFKFIRSSLLALAVLALGLPVASARPFHGGVAAPGGGGGTLLTTVTVQNTSGSTQATNFVTPTGGQPFVEGQIPNGCAGSAPIYKLHGTSTVVPFSEGTAPVCWSDGSLKWAPFMWLVPSSVAGAGSIDLDVYSGGTTPAPSSRTLADVCTGSPCSGVTDLNVSVTGLDNLSGVWVANLNQGISAAHADDYTYMDGDAGKVVRVRASFRQAGADHGQLESYWWLELLNDSSGNFGGMRYMARVTQPWYNIDSPAKDYRSFSAFTLNNGASLIRDMMGTKFNVGKNFTWTSGNQFSSTANGFDTTFLVRLTTTSSLPTGLSTGTNYFINSPLGNANAFSLANSPTSAAHGSGYITPTGACSGTCTATAYPYLPMFNSLFTAGPNGQYDYIQAGGSVAADSTVRLAYDNIYWRSTKLIGPYDFGNVHPSNGTASTYYPQSSGSADHNIGKTGEDDGIGPFTNWAVTHMYNSRNAGGDAADEQSVRVTALAAGGMATNLKNNTTFTVPVVNNGHANNGVTYTGMPAANLTFNWPGENNIGVSGFTAPLNGSNTSPIYNGGFSSPEFGHIPDFEYYATLFTGEPQFNDMLVEFGADAQNHHAGFLNPGTATINGSTNSICGVAGSGSGQRNCTINGTTYYGTTTLLSNGLREVAWTNRTLGYACAIGGGYEPAGAATRQYLCDMSNTIYKSYNAYTGILPAYASTNGMFMEGGGLNSHIPMWQFAYLQLETAMVSQMTEDVDALTFATYTAKFDKFIYVNGGNTVWNIPSYNPYGRIGVSNTPAGNTSLNPYLTDFSLYAVGGVGQISWTNGSPTFTLGASGRRGNYTPQNGHIVNFGFPDGGVPQGVAPGGFASYTPYYVQNVSGSGTGATFELSLTPGGAGLAAQPSDTLSNVAFSAYAIGLNNGSNADNGGTGTGIMQSTTAAINAIQNVGGTVDSTTCAAMNNNLQAQAGWAAALADVGLKYSFKRLC